METPERAAYIYLSKPNKLDLKDIFALNNKLKRVLTSEVEIWFGGN